LAYVGGDQALLFGGEDNNSPPYFNDTWVYDLSDNAWTQKSPTTSPSGREYHAMAYLGNEWVILFGGFTQGGHNNETWIAGGMGPTAVTLSSFRADAPSFDLWQWLTKFLGR
jgi:hypothetical protein